MLAFYPNESTIDTKTTYNIVTPASLKQWARISVVQDLSIRLDKTIGRDCLCGYVEPEFTFYTWRPILLIVFVDAGLVFVSRMQDEPDSSLTRIDYKEAGQI